MERGGQPDRHSFHTSQDGVGNLDVDESKRKIES